MPKVPLYQIGSVQSQGAPAVTVPRGGQAALAASALLQRTTSSISSINMQVMQQQKARTDNAVVNGALSTAGVEINKAVFDAEQRKGSDALADMTGEREDERSVSEITKERIDDIVKEHRASAVTADQLAAIDKYLPTMASNAMLSVHRHEAAQNRVVEKASFDAAKAEKTNEIVRLANNGPLDSEAMMKAEGDLEELVYDYNVAQGITDEKVIGQEIVIARSNAFMMGLIRSANKGFVSWANDQFDSLKEEDNRDKWGPALTEADEATLERSLGRITDAAETRDFIGKQVENQKWSLEAKVTGKQRQEGEAAIRKQYPPGVDPEKTDLALDAWHNRINEHDANVAADMRDARETTFRDFIEQGIPPDKVPTELWDRMDEEGRKAMRSYHSNLLAKQAGHGGPKYTDRNVRHRVESLGPDEFLDYVEGRGAPDGSTLASDSGEISDQDFEEWEDRARKMRGAITPIEQLKSSVQSRLEVNFPFAEHEEITVDTIQVWTQRLVADIAQEEKDRDKGRFTLDEIYERVDKAAGYWLERQVGADPRRYHLQFRTGVPAPEDITVTQFYEPYDEIPKHHRVVVAKSLDIDLSESLSRKDKRRIEEKYAQDYLYPMSKPDPEDRLSFLISDIAQSEDEIIGTTLQREQDAVQAVDTATFYAGMSAADIAWAEGIANANGIPPTEQNVVEMFKRGTLDEQLEEFRKREDLQGKGTSMYTDPELMYLYAVENGWGDEAEALSGWSPRSSVLEERTGLRP